MRIFLKLGALFGFLAVALGAFGAHALRSRISPEMLAVYQTGVLYHLLHAVVLVALGQSLRASRCANASGWFMSAGVVIFSGSLYALAISGVKVWGAVTPIGGVCFLAGWGCLFVNAVRDRT